MSAINWKPKQIAVAELFLDAKNPRLGVGSNSVTPRDIARHLFDNDKAMEIAESIALRGFFVNEPLLAVREKRQTIVVEGNRRLAALKALLEPELLEGSKRRRLETLSKKIPDIASIRRIPVVIANSRRDTDRLIAGRHVGTPVLSWKAENRASFILEKLDEGYTELELKNQLGFSGSDIQNARQTRAIADMTKAIKLPADIKAKVDSRKSKVLTTLERVFESSVGREYLHIVPDNQHGFRGTTTASEFTKGFTKLVTDIATGKQSSRTLNTNEDIRKYFEGLNDADRPAKKAGSFVPGDIINSGNPANSTANPQFSKANKSGKAIHKTVIPKSLKVRYGTDRLVDIRNELTKLDRTKFPNAGAVLLRVFLELCATDYLNRTGDMATLTARLGGKGKLKYGVPQMNQMTPELVRIVKSKLSPSDAAKVEKAITYNPSAPFSISDLHSFVHSASDIPGERDILQFWLRTEPLFRLMVEEDV